MAATYERIKLTKPVVEGAQPALVDGKTRQKVIFDTEVAGFGLLVGSKSKTFFAQQGLNGKVVRVTIGRFPAKTVEEARKAAKGLIGQMSDGKNPTEEKRKKRAQAFTLAEAWELEADTLRAKGRSPKTLHRYEHTVNLYLKGWLKRNLTSITREDVRLKHKKIAEDVAKGTYAKGRVRTKDHGHSTANDVFRVFRAIWNRARRQHPELPEAPTANVDWFPTTTPRTALSPETLRIWYQTVMADTNLVRRDNLLLMLFTALRRTNASEVRWEDVDFERRVLRIPRPKSGTPFDLPLSDYLLELFSQRWIENASFAPGSPWVFPAESASGHIKEPRLDVPGVNWTPHDLRRTFITITADMDIRHYALKALVNHDQPSARNDVTAGYVKVTVEGLRAPMQAITDRLLAICEGPGPSAEVVVPIRRDKLSL